MPVQEVEIVRNVLELRPARGRTGDAGGRAKRTTALRDVPPWRSWKCSNVARYQRFIETYLTAPVVRTPFKLHPYQLALLEGWLDPSTRLRMDKMARGNAKSTTAAAFIAAHLFITDDAQCPIIATTLVQARLTTYGQLSTMLETSPLEPYVKLYKGMGTERIYVPSTNGLAIPLADKPSSLQGLNPSIGLCDEASELSPEVWAALTLAAGKRPDSIALGISTPSFAPENAMLAVERAFKGGNAPGLVFHEHAAPAGCDHRDESNWHLANPALGTKPPILHIDALRTSLAMESEQSFRCYRLAQWPEQAAGGWLGDTGYEVWSALASPWKLIPNAPTWAAVDMARTSDCAALVLGQWRSANRFHVTAKVWHATDGTIDPTEVLDACRQAHRDYDVQALGYDPAYFDLAAVMLEREGVRMVEFPQQPARMVPAVRGCYEAIHSQRLSHDGADDLSQHVMNAVVKPQEQGFTLQKTRQRFKIDACVAMVMCHRLATSTEPEKKVDDLMLSVM